MHSYPIKSRPFWANWSIIVMLGPVYLAGVAIPVTLAVILGWLVAKDRADWRLRPAEIWLAVFATAYFIYFFTSGWFFGGPVEAFDFARENLAFAFVIPLIYLMRTLDYDYVFAILARVLFPGALILLLGTGVEHFYFGVARVDFLTISPLILAPLIVGSFYLSIADWRNQGALWRLGAAAAGLVGLYVIADLASSRASALIFGMALGLFIILAMVDYRRSLAQQAIKLTLFAAALVVVFIGALYLLYLSEIFPRLQPVLVRIFTGEGALDTSTQLRVTMLNLSLGEFREAPFFGYGLAHTFDAIAAKWPYQEFQLGHLHSDILNHLVGGGAVGFLIYCGFVLSPLVAFFINRNRHAVAIYVIAMVVFLEVMGGLSARLLLRNMLYIWAIVATVFAVGLSEQERLGKFRPDTQ